MGTGVVRTWIPEINLMRGFAILAVIMIHVTTLSAGFQILTPLAYVNIVADAFLHFAVPLFIIISGVSLAHNYWVGTKWLQFYRRRLLLILPPYFLFSAIFIVYSFYLGKPYSISEIGKSLLFGTAWYHLWFIPLIIELYLLYPLFVRAYGFLEKRGSIGLFVLSGLAVQIGIALALTQIYAENLEFAGANVGYYVTTLSFPGYIFYFMLGIYVGRNIGKAKERIKNARLYWFALFIIISGSAASLFFSVASYNVPHGISLPASFAIWNLAIPLLTVSTFVVSFRFSSRLAVGPTRIGGFVNEIGTYAFGIYLVHPLFIEVFNSILSNQFGISYQDAVFYPLLALLTIIASYVFVKVVVRLPYGGLILGIKPRRPDRSPPHAIG